MKGVFKNSYEAGDAALREAPDPVVGPGEVVVRVAAAGICGTDLKIFQSHYFKYKPPVIMGHEFGGVVVAVGPGVEGIPMGAVVTARSTVSTCGKCRYCVTGQENLCDQRTRLGFDFPGVFADFVKVPVDKVHPLPKGVSATAGALVEPMAVVTHAGQQVGIGASDVVLITGPGPIGLLSLLLAKAEGAFTIISGLHMDRPRLEMAEQLGADLVVDAEEQDLAAAVMGVTGGVGADVVMECSGTAGGITTGLTLGRKAGRYVQVGTWSGPLTVDFMQIAYRELKVAGSFGHMSLDWNEAIRLMATGKVDPTRLVGATMPMAEWAEAFHILEQRGGPKILLVP